MDEKPLDSEFISNQRLRRNELLPTWIKVFMWIFLIGGFVAPIGIIMGIMGQTMLLGLYGIETMLPLSFIGLIVIGLFCLKGVVSFGMLKEQSWAINFAIGDALLGIVICVCVMLGLVGISGGVIRLELLLLIPYLVKMWRIKDEWSERVGG